MTDPKHNLLILGTGNVATALARRFKETGHDVHIGSRDAARGKAHAEQHGVKGGHGPSLVEDADIVFLAIPFSALDETLAGAGSLAGKIVVDCTNPLTDDFMQLTVGHTDSAGEAVQRALPEARVVKAFNAMFAEVLGDPPTFEPGPKPQIFCASDDAEAKAVVSGLIRDVGLEPVDCGALQNARYLEPLAELIIQVAYVVGEGTTFTPVFLRPGSS
jgi:NADPH-dependent F420 reductase